MCSIKKNGSCGVGIERGREFMECLQSCNYKFLWHSEHVVSLQVCVVHLAAWQVGRSVFSLVLQKQFIPLRQDNHESMHNILWVIARKILSPTPCLSLSLPLLKVTVISGNNRELFTALIFFLLFYIALLYNYRFMFSTSLTNYAVKTFHSFN